MAKRTYINRSLTDNEKERICSRCMVVKSVDNFHKKLDSFSSYCILCSRQYVSTWQKRTKDERRDFNKSYYEKNKQKIIQRQIEWSNKDPMRKWFQSIKAAKRQIGISIEIQWKEIKILLEKQNNVCALTGLPFLPNGLKEKGKFQWDSPSLDKINPNDGYSINNVRVILYCVNAFKGRMSDEDMIFVAEKLLSYKNSDAIKGEFNLKE